MNESFIIGTDNTIREFGDSSFNNGTGGVVLLTCFTNTAEVLYPSHDLALASNSESYVVEASSEPNPLTGGTYSFNDPLENTTAFAKDNATYPDYNAININRHLITPVGIDEFNRAFPQHNLTGSQFCVAATSFHMQELGHRFTVFIRSEEDYLLQFCSQQNWNYLLHN